MDIRSKKVGDISYSLDEENKSLKVKLRMEKKKEGDTPLYPKGRTDKKERACTKETSRPKTFVPDKDPPKPIYPKK